jgi:hypothetical protein
VFSSAFPAYSDPVNITGNPTSPRDGESNLLDIEKEAQKAVLKTPIHGKRQQLRRMQVLTRSRELLILIR